MLRRNKVMACIIAGAMMLNSTTSLRSVFAEDTEDKVLEKAVQGEAVNEEESLYINQEEEKETEVVAENEGINLSFEEFALDSEVFSNGDQVGFTIKVKSDKKITGMYGTIIGDTNNPMDTFLINGEVVKVEGDYYTVHFKASTSGEGSRPIEYMASANYRIEYLGIGYEYQQGEHSEYSSVSYVDTRSEDKKDYIEYDFSGLDFLCNNPEEDIIAPSIDDIILDKNVVVEGDKVNVSIKVSDNKSGFDKWYDMYLVWYNPDDEMQVIMNMASYNEDTGCFECEVDISGEMYNEDLTGQLPLKPGVYKIEVLGLADYAWNRVEYNRVNNAELLAKADITVVDKDSEEDEDNDDNGGEVDNPSEDNKEETKDPSEENNPDKDNKEESAIKDTTTDGKDKLPQTGGFVSSGAVTLLGTLLVASGGVLSFKRKK